MPRLEIAVMNRRIQTLVATNKSFLRAETTNPNSMDKAGRKFLLSITRKNSGTQNLSHVLHTSLYQANMTNITKNENTDTEF